MAQKRKGPTMTDWTPERIKALRLARGESQEEFARHFRLTVGSVRVWEQEKKGGHPNGAATVILDQLAEQAKKLAAAAK